jgi:hypothetical protein
MSSPTITVLDPSVLGPAERITLPAPVAGAWGRVLGIRVDRAWPSFLQVANRFAALARERLQVRDVKLFDPDIRIGTTEEERRKIAGFVRDIDMAIVGLGTRGSCTSWSVHDTVEVLRSGKPAAVVVTEVFVNLAQTAARARGVDPIPMLVLPHPMEAAPRTRSTASPRRASMR